MNGPGMDSDRLLRQQLLAAREGDRPALELVIRRLYPMIEAQVRRRAGNWPDQERKELSSQVIEWLYAGFSRHFALYQADQEPAPFIRIVIERLIFRYCKRTRAGKRRSEALTDPLEAAEFESGLEREPPPLAHQLEARQVLARLQPWLETLSLEEQTIFWEKVVEGRETKAVAGELGLRPNTVDVKATRLRERLRGWAVKQRLVAAVLLTMALWRALSGPPWAG